MKTVKDYLDLGLVFVGGDKGYKHIIESFAWRNNDGVKPEYKGLIEVEMKSGAVMRNKEAGNLMWSLMLGGHYIIAKWRPTVLQSDDSNGDNDVSLKLPDIIYNPELIEAFKSLKGHLESKPPFWSKSMQIFSCPCVAVNIEASKPTVSPKEDKPMKPVYTAEMHEKGERPPVGAECILIVNDEPRPAKVTYIGKDIVCCSNVDGDAEYACLLGRVSFKPIIKTIKVNGLDVPAPMSEAPEVGSMCFVASINNPAFFYSIYWETVSCNKTALSRGLIHLTKESAIAHAKAMLGIDPNA